MKRSTASASNHHQVLKILQAAGAPMTAYEVLDAARRHHISAPPTVYRALNKLIEQGSAHRLESINAYVACIDQHHRHDAAVFAICRDCGRVQELSEAGAFRRLKDAAGQSGFLVEDAVIELRGQCETCIGAQV